MEPRSVLCHYSCKVDAILNEINREVFCFIEGITATVPVVTGKTVKIILDILGVFLLVFFFFFNFISFLFFPSNNKVKSLFPVLVRYYILCDISAENWKNQRCLVCECIFSLSS